MPTQFPISFKFIRFFLDIFIVFIINMITCRRELEGRWGEESDQYMDKVMDSVLKAVDDGGAGGDKDRYGFR